jgi:hypothetical protein
MRSISNFIRVNIVRMYSRVSRVGRFSGISKISRVRRVRRDIENFGRGCGGYCVRW